MSHFNLESAITEATKLDGPMQRGPPMRWQRKAMEAGVRSLSLDGINNVGVGPNSARTPGIAFTKSPLGLRQTPSSAAPTGKTMLTPHKTPNKKTPSKSAPPSPRRAAADRFIPNRTSMDMDAAHHMITRENVNPVDPTQSPASSEYQRKMCHALNKGAGQNTKILSFSTKAPEAREGYMNNLKAIYTAGQNTKTPGVSSRHIPQYPDQVLDAPELLNDYYLNLISWSSQNHLAAGLGSSVYLWNASTGDINPLCEYANEEDYVCSVSWIAEGNILAVGNNLGAVELWDVGQQKLMRTMGGHAGRISSLAWNSYILSSGSRTGRIHHHDVRVPDHHVGTLSGHNGEVCGLTWSPNGRQLASGSNDNLVCVWDASLDHETQPLYSFSHHQAAVKALAWCPWQANLLASGGGTADRQIRLWNTTTGSCLNNIDTNSQVCSILWSKEHKELISGHGYSQNQLTIWKYPSMVRVADLKGHTARILSLAMSPDGSTVVSAGADESLMLWKCFVVDKVKKVTAVKPTQKKSSVLMRGIR